MLSWSNVVFWMSSRLPILLRAHDPQLEIVQAKHLDGVGEGKFLCLEIIRSKNRKALFQCPCGSSDIGGADFT
jgi:hypothetical protein